jgi:hypothetical protein
MTKDEALKLALAALEMCEVPWTGTLDHNLTEAITAIKQALAAPVQEPVAWMSREDYDDYLEESKVTSATVYNYQLDIPLYTAPPAAPDLQAELDATNRQVEILSDALAESRREVARLKAVQEPVAWMHVMDNTEGIKANGKGIVSITQKRKHPFGKPGVDFSKSFPVTSTPLYTTQPAAQRQWVGLTDEEIEKACVPLGAAMMSFAEVTRVIEAKLKEKNNG